MIRIRILTPNDAVIRLKMEPQVKIADIKAQLCRQLSTIHLYKESNIVVGKNDPRNKEITSSFVAKGGLLLVREQKILLEDKIAGNCLRDGDILSYEIPQEHIYPIEPSQEKFHLVSATELTEALPLFTTTPSAFSYEFPNKKLQFFHENEKSDQKFMDRKVFRDKNRRLPRQWCNNTTTTITNEIPITTSTSLVTGKKSAHESLLLRACLQFIDRLITLQSEIQQLIFVVRDAKSKGVCTVQELLPSLLQMVHGSTMDYLESSFVPPNPQLHGSTSTNMTSSNSNGQNTNSIRGLLYPSNGSNRNFISSNSNLHTSVIGSNRSGSARIGAVAGGGGGSGGVIFIAKEGWAECSNWGAIWLHKRTEYVCLYESKLYFFNSKKQKEEFFYELAREKKGFDTEISRKILKENTPQTIFELEAGWDVRLGKEAFLEYTAQQQQQQSISMQQPSSDQSFTSVLSNSQSNTASKRFAFALFDAKKTLRLILDVDSVQEANEWVRVIGQEIKYNELYERLKRLHPWSTIPSNMKESQCAESRSIATSGGTLEEYAQAIGTHFEFPLCWIHAKQTPLESLFTFSASNNKNSSNGASLNATAISTGTTWNQALKDLQRDRLTVNGNYFLGNQVEDIIAFISQTILHLTRNYSNHMTPLCEMDALRFARRLLICSSRTHAGGDILDTLHILMKSDQFCICPDSPTMEPIEITIIQDESHQVVAEISLKMTYRVVPTDLDLAQKCNQGKIIGKYRQKLVCNLKNWLEVHGSVCIDIVHKQNSIIF